MFAWAYDDLNNFNPLVMQHIILMKQASKPFQQKLRKFHSTLEPTIKKELNKILDAKIIFPIRHTQWVANLVPVRKENGDIRLCVDSRNLNKSYENDNYPVPPMEQILHKFSRFDILSLLDGFL